MGLGKADVDAMSLWEFAAAVDGYNEAHSPEEEAATLTDQEADEISKWLDESP